MHLSHCSAWHKISLLLGNVVTQVQYVLHDENGLYETLKGNLTISKNLLVLGQIKT